MKSEYSEKNIDETNLKEHLNASSNGRLLRERHDVEIGLSSLSKDSSVDFDLPLMCLVANVLEEGRSFLESMNENDFEPVVERFGDGLSEDDECLVYRKYHITL